MTYRVVMDSDYNQFTNKVNEAIADGWELGGFAVRTHVDESGTSYPVYYQSLVK